MTQNQLARRAFLATAGATLGAMRVSGAEFPKELGRRRGPTVTARRSSNRSFAFCQRQAEASSYRKTPLQDLFGIITPSGLHYEVHHSGVPEIDPHHHEVMIHGLVERPFSFTMEDFHRLPSVSRIHFLEFAGNRIREADWYFIQLRFTDPQRLQNYPGVICHMPNACHR